MAANLWSSSPAIVSTGMFISCRRGHNDSCAPVPASRRLPARPSAVLVSRSARCWSSTISPANSGRASHSSRKASTPTSTMWSASFVVSRSALGALVVVGDARRPADDGESANEVWVDRSRPAGTVVRRGCSRRTRRSRTSPSTCRRPCADRANPGAAAVSGTSTTMAS